MPFTLPAETKEGLSKSTMGVYKTRLNRISEFGIDNLEKLLTNSKHTLRIINILVKRELVSEGKSQEQIDKDTRQLRRNYLNAIFYVLPAEVRNAPNPYYKNFQSAKDPY
jgi:hypothetical protein